MKIHLFLKKYLFLWPLVILLLAHGCNERSTNPGLLADYQLNGALIVDENLDTAVVVIDLKRNDSIVTDADITFHNDTMIFNALNFSIDYVYSLVKSSLTGYLLSTPKIAIRDSGYFHDTVTVVVADTFSILTIEPPNRLLPGGGSVTVQWSGSSNADGYILAAVLRDSVYTGKGYSAYSTSMSTADNIPTVAFTDGINTIFGWYYIYVYAYAGSPGYNVTRDILPVPLPGQLTENINVPDLKGCFGSVIIAARDSVQVYAVAK